MHTANEHPFIWYKLLLSLDTNCGEMNTMACKCWLQSRRIHPNGECGIRVRYKAISPRSLNNVTFERIAIVPNSIRVNCRLEWVFSVCKALNYACFPLLSRAILQISIAHEFETNFRGNSHCERYNPTKHMTANTKTPKCKLQMSMDVMNKMLFILTHAKCALCSLHLNACSAVINWMDLQCQIKCQILLYK